MLPHEQIFGTGQQGFFHTQGFVYLVPSIWYQSLNYMLQKGPSTPEAYFTAQFLGLKKRS